MRKLPKLKSDEAAARFVAEADLTAYDLGALRPARFEYAPKEARVNMRLPGALLDAVKASAKRAGIPYQRFIRQALEASVAPRRR